MKCKRTITQAQRDRKNRKQRITSAQKRKANVAAGLRCDGKPRTERKPCGCMTGSCLLCVRTGNKLIVPMATVLTMHADYMGGMTLNQVGRKYPMASGKPRLHGEVSAIFKRRGLYVRPFKALPRQPNGSPVRIALKTPSEIASLIKNATKIAVPIELKLEWRRWSLAKRKAFITRLRKRFPSTRPTGPFSTNVKPFVYGDDFVHAIAKKMNVGRNSRTKLVALKPTTEGVVFEGEIYFWTGDSYTKGCGWTPGLGRPQLNRVVYEKFNGPIPPSTTVIHKDGNKNNFLPANLVLRHRADCAKANQVFLRLQKNPGDKTLRVKANHVAERLQQGLRRSWNLKSRNKAAALLDQFKTPSTGGLFAALTKRTS